MIYERQFVFNERLFVLTDTCLLDLSQNWLERRSRSYVGIETSELPLVEHEVD